MWKFCNYPQVGRGMKALWRSDGRMAGASRAQGSLIKLWHCTLCQSAVVIVEVVTFIRSLRHWRETRQRRKPVKAFAGLNLWRRFQQRKTEIKEKPVVKSGHRLSKADIFAGKFDSLGEFLRKYYLTAIYIYNIAFNNQLLIIKFYLKRLSINFVLHKTHDSYMTRFSEAFIGHQCTKWNMSFDWV